MEVAIIVTVISIGSVTLALLIALAIRRKLSGRGDVEKSNPRSEWPNPPSAGCGVSEGWVEFVEERLYELSASWNAEEPKCALGVVDFLDELRESYATDSPDEQSSSEAIQRALKDILYSNGYTILDSDEWNPETQRAVAVAHKPDATGTKILGKGSSGLARNGKLIRKQEVKVEMKGK